MSENFTLHVPKKENSHYLESEWSLSICFSNLPLEIICKIFIALLLEQSIIFFTENIFLLTATINTFICLIKPLEWPHPLIFNLPLNLIQIFDSPVPVLVGNILLKFIIFILNLY